MLALGLPGEARAQDAERGALLAGLAGCASCHTEKGGVPYAGGYILESPQGKFYGPNITPDAETGIGTWTEHDLRRALRKGTSPEGRPYYPSFPYPSYTKLTDADIADLWAYLQGLVPVTHTPPRHEVKGLASWRFLLRFWKLTGLQRGPDEATDDPTLDRGRYLVDAVGHCGECHTPRGGLGRMKRKRYLAGSDLPPEPSPNITPHAHGTEGWSPSDWTSLLHDGMTPEGDFVGGEMRRVVREGTSQLTDPDLQAMIRWLRQVPPVPSDPPPEPEEQDEEEEDWL